MRTLTTTRGLRHRGVWDHVPNAKSRPAVSGANGVSLASSLKFTRKHDLEKLWQRQPLQFGLAGRQSGNSRKFDWHAISTLTLEKSEPDLNIT